MSENKKISLIVPVYYEEEVLPIAYPRMKAALEQTGYDHEIIFVNDGSRDGTMKVLRDLADDGYEPAREELDEMYATSEWSECL